MWIVNIFLNWLKIYYFIVYFSILVSFYIFSVALYLKLGEKLGKWQFPARKRISRELYSILVGSGKGQGKMRNTPLYYPILARHLFRVSAWKDVYWNVSGSLVEEKPPHWGLEVLRQHPAAVVRIWTRVYWFLSAHISSSISRDK